MTRVVSASNDGEIAPAIAAASLLSTASAMWSAGNWLGRHWVKGPRALRPEVNPQQAHG
jgi:hypothetical protein